MEISKLKMEVLDKLFREGGKELAKIIFLQILKMLEEEVVPQERKCGILCAISLS
jgi:hypothetical protein